MDNARKKELARSYREQKVRAGIFAVRCTVSGEVWVAQTPDIDKRQNGLWFQLRMGGFPGKSLQKAWATHGEAEFAFEVLEEVRHENAAMVPLLLKEREEHWRKALGAAALV